MQISFGIKYTNLDIKIIKNVKKTLDKTYVECYNNTTLIDRLESLAICQRL